MATKIVTKNSSTASAVPTASDLVQGELAVNVADKRLFTEDNAGAIVELGTNPSGNVTFQDNGKAIFGAGSDLQIYHTGSYSAITDVGTGAFYIGGADFVDIGNSTLSETSARFHVNDRVDLYHNNAIKLATTSTGIDVTGTATMDSLTVDGTGDGVKATIGKTGGTNLNIYADTNTVYLAGSSALSTAYIIDQTNNNMQFKVNAAERMRIDSSGNVGIGTSSPASLMHLAATAPVLSFTDTNSFTDVNDRFIVRATSDKGNIQWYDDSASTTSELMTFLPSGNVGIGTSSPSAKLDVNGGGLAIRVDGTANTSRGILLRNTGTAEGQIQTDGNMHFIQEDAGKYMRFSTANTERMRIDSSGTMLIGTSSVIGGAGGTGAQLFLKQSANSNGISSVANSNDNYVRMLHTGTIGKLETTYGSGSYTPLAFFTAGAERMRIDSSGNLLVGTTTAAGKLTLRQDSTTASPLFIVNAAISGKFATFEGNGAVHGSITWSGSTTSYNTSSDQRLKENIADADDAGSKIDAIQVRQYDWKADGSHQDYGMIAQELQAVAPEAVSVPEDSEEMMGVDYSKLVPMLIKEIQSLRNRVASLEE